MNDPLNQPLHVIADSVCADQVLVASRRVKGHMDLYSMEAFITMVVIRAALRLTNQENENG